MEKTPKSKFFSLKSRNSNKPRTKRTESTPENNVISEKDVTDLETLPIEDIMKTPKRPNNARTLDLSAESPQCRVGWDDGCDSNMSIPEIGMESPVYMPSTKRKLRRCPQELYDRASRQSIPPKPRNFEDDCDMAQCFSWAKNLMDITAPESETLQAEDAALGPILDDSNDELLVMCSQAVEESLSRAVNVKRALPSSVSCQPKKAKVDEAAKRMATRSDKNGTRSLPVENRISKVLQFSPNDVVANNNTRLDNFNYQRTPREGPSKVTAKKSEKLVDSMDLFKSFLDDDDEFRSLDFNYIDNLQNMHSQNLAPAANNPKPVVRYTKEQIEQRRLEAKKKLLFKMKNRSM